MVAHEKHGTYYYDALTLDAWAKASLSLLKERFEAGWYYDPEAPLSDFEVNYLAEYEKYLNQDEASVEALPEEARELVRRKQAYAKSMKKEKAAYREWYQEMRNVVENRLLTILINGHGEGRPLAFQLLYERHGEYERVSLETLQTGE
jgi:hypothetical protein